MRTQLRCVLDTLKQRAANEMLFLFPFECASGSSVVHCSGEFVLQASEIMLCETKTVTEMQFQ